MGLSGYVAAFLTLVTLSRAAERLRGELGARLTATLYVLLALKLVRFVAHGVLRYLDLPGSAELSALRTGLGWAAHVFGYAYSVLLLLAVWRLVRSVKLGTADGVPPTVPGAPAHGG